MRRISKENKIWLALLIAAIAFAGIVEFAHADIGDIEVCAAQTGLTTHDIPTGSNARTAQTFTTTTGFTITGVKIPVQHDGTPSGTVGIQITGTSGGFPDLSTVLTSETVNQSVFPARSGTATDQTLICSSESENPGGTVIEFTTPVFLSPATQYAIVMFGSAGMQWGILPEAVGGSTLGLNGQSWECSETIFNCNNPGAPDWGKAYGTDQSSGIVLFNNVSPDVPDGTFDTWLDNFLSSMGMNSPVGRLLVGTLFGGIIFFVLSIKGVPWIIALGLTGMSITVLTAAMIFSPAILLGLVAIIGLGIMAAVLSQFTRGGDG